MIWWGYKHINGTYQAKRFFDKEDIDDAYESPFVSEVVPPFKADGRDEALEIIRKKIEMEDDS